MVNSVTSTSKSSVFTSAEHEKQQPALSAGESVQREGIVRPRTTDAHAFILKAIFWNNIKFPRPYLPNCLIKEITAIVNNFLNLYQDESICLFQERSGSNNSKIKAPVILLTDNGFYSFGRKLGEGSYSKVYDAAFVPLERMIWKDGKEYAPHSPRMNLAVSLFEKKNPRNRDIYPPIKNNYDRLPPEVKKWVNPIYAVGKDVAQVEWMVSKRCKGDLLAFDYSQCQDPVATAFKFIQDLGEALRAFHEAGWVHRDIKVANILIDDNNDIRIGDLGFLVEMGQPVRWAGTYSCAPRKAESSDTPGKGLVKLIQQVPSEISARQDVYGYGKFIYGEVRRVLDALRNQASKAAQSGDNIEPGEAADPTYQLKDEEYQRLEVPLMRARYEGKFSTVQIEAFGRENGGGRAIVLAGRQNRTIVYLEPSLNTTRTNLDAMYMLFKENLSGHQQQMMEKMLSWAIDFQDEGNPNFPESLVGWGAAASSAPKRKIACRKALFLDDDEASSSQPEKRARKEAPASVEDASDFPESLAGGEGTLPLAYKKMTCKKALFVGRSGSSSGSFLELA